MTFINSSIINVIYVLFSDRNTSDYFISAFNRIRETLFKVSAGNTAKVKKKLNVWHVTLTWLPDKILFASALLFTIL